MSETRFWIRARAVLAIFFPSYLIRDLSVLVFPLSLVVLLFEEFPCVLLQQSFALCPMIWQLKHWFSFICFSRSSTVILSMSIAFGSHIVFVYLGVKVLFVWLVLVLDVPWCRPSISFILLYCASYLDACSYHSLIHFGMVGCEKNFWRIPTFNPSMKYLISVVLSVILALPDRILNCEM